MSTSITTTENFRAVKSEEPVTQDRPTLAASPLETSIPESLTLPGYEVLDCLGQGGMGVVYKARHLVLNRLVAIKVLLAGTHATSFARKRFRAEAEALACLNHPHFVQIHEVGEHKGQPFFVMEYMVGGSLAEYAGAALLPTTRSAQLLRDLAGAVHYAHQRGIVHRDVKPGNVLLTEDAVAKICDFGVARQLHARQRKGGKPRSKSRVSLDRGSTPFLCEQKADWIRRKGESPRIERQESAPFILKHQAEVVDGPLFGQLARVVGVALCGESIQVDLRKPLAKPAPSAATAGSAWKP